MILRSHGLHGVLSLSSHKLIKGAGSRYLKYTPNMHNRYWLRSHKGSLSPVSFQNNRLIKDKQGADLIKALFKYD